MSERTYLSIGDVLTLLKEEFPDVTISKIRFLESQGLLDPERTPSGYRKFYDDDVARLRWILRQQRENFLPLKVIKDRLEDVPPPGETNGGGPATGGTDGEPAGTAGEDAPGLGHAAASASASGSGDPSREPGRGARPGGPGT
ncbi:MAG: MerR family transcriptional regulator, partial [Acidimicrobiales bacterium]